MKAAWLCTRYLASDWYAVGRASTPPCPLTALSRDDLVQIRPY
jgi:hypothetical protein